VTLPPIEPLDTACATLANSPAPIVADDGAWPANTKLLLTPEEAATLLGIGRTKLYRLLATGDLPSVRIDGSRRVTATALVEFVARLAQAGTLSTANSTAMVALSVDIKAARTRPGIATPTRP